MGRSILNYYIHCIGGVRCLARAADLADAKLDHDNAVKVALIAEDIKANAAKHLYNPERKSLYKAYARMKAKYIKTTR